MAYKVRIELRALDDINRHIKAGNKKLADKAVALIDELAVHPRIGKGKPEQLKGYSNKEMWSRRIDTKNRLVYEIKESELVVVAIAAYGHYGDK